MPRHSYREHDYTFGQIMMTLRTGIGLTQVGLADLLGVSRRAVGEWEAGSNYPKAEHFKHFLALCVQHHVFTPEREEEEIRAFWKTSHQRVLLDETWLHTLLISAPPEGRAPAREAPDDSGSDASHSIASIVSVPTPSFPRMDWVGALDVSRFTGREGELAELSRWMVHEQCRLIAILGMGGIGKSALVSLLGKQLAPQFDAVLWRSLRDAPSCEDLVADCLTFFSETPPAAFPASLEQRINQLLARLQASRCLLVLDNLETVLVSSDPKRNYLPGYEGYGRLIQRLAESAHQSCVLLTSREKPREIEPLEGVRSSVRSLRLVGMEEQAARVLLTDKGLSGTPTAWQRLVAGYAGNPLALKIVAQAVFDLFGGDIDSFLHEGELVFNGVRPVLRQQVGRLTPLEHLLLTWLAVLREWTELPTLLQVLHPKVLRAQVLEALEALGRRSLLERGQQVSFSLQSVVMEYLTDTLCERLAEEIVLGNPQQLRQVALEQAQAKDYVRETQVRLLVHPLLEQLRSELGADSLIESHLLRLLSQFRTEDMATQGYGPANALSLLKDLHGHLRGLDLSQLAIRGAYLQGIEMQDANLSGTLMRECVLSEAFDAISAVAISPNGQFWAAASRRGEVRLWEEGQILHQIWRAHTDRIRVLAFSPDGNGLITGSWDTTMKLWDVASGALLWSDWPTSNIPSVAFAPDGRLLATSGGNVAMVHLWDLQAGNRLETLSHRDPVSAIAWSPNGRLLASGDFEGHIWLWQVQKNQPATCLQTFTGHSNWVAALVFAPDSSLLASGSGDGLVKLWEVGEEGSLRLRQALAGHTDGLNRVAWSPDGGTLASGSRDTTIRLWDAKLGNTRAVLQGHTGEVYGLAFTPDSRHLLSGSDDGTLRLWEVESSQCVRIMHGYVSSLLSLDWSPDGAQLASGGTDALVTVWDVTSGKSKMLRGHRGVVSGVGWSPDGRFLASSGWDNAIRLWDPASGASLQRHQDPDHPDTVFFEIAWSPNGQQLASGTNLRGVYVWEVTTGSHRWVGRHLPTRVRHVAWSLDGTRLAGAGDDGALYVWDATDGTQKQRLLGHHGVVTGVAWSRDGTRLASSGRARDRGELFVWDAQSGERLSTLEGHQGLASAVVWSPCGKLLISGGGDGHLCWWVIHSGECLRVQEGHQGTVHALKVSPSGHKLASCGDDGAIVLWDLESGEQLQTLRRDRPYERLDITGIQDLTEAQKASLRALGAFEETSGGG